MDEEGAQEGMNMKIDNGGQKNIQHQVGGGGQLWNLQTIRCS
jgi:hypothetical protein